MEGLEGFKLLQTNVNSTDPLYVRILIGIVIIIVVFNIWLIVLAFVEGMFNPARFKKDVTKYMSVILIVTGFVLGIYFTADKIIVETYEITSIVDKPYIDLNIYNIVESKGEIITIERK